jgi:ribosomal protein S18 acetylase RimI-like enzyme
MKEKMTIERIYSKQTILEYYCRDANSIPLHIYEIGDLDDFFFPNTQWFALMDDGESNTRQQENAMLFLTLQYQAPDLTVLLAFATTDNELQLARSFFQQQLPFLPDAFFSHLTPGIEDVFSSYYNLEPHGLYSKMVIRDKNSTRGLIKNTLAQSETQPRQLVLSQLEEILKFYQISYPGNWFDPRMLETGQTFGLFLKDNEDLEVLVAIAGIHVYSKEYSVASLGNIATHPSYRNRGFSKIVTATLVKSLVGNDIETIGLNVRSDNSAAIQCYESLGFGFVVHYEENMWKKKS